MGNKLIIYTDGACSNNQGDENVGGYGAVLLFGNAKKEIYGGEANTTNNKMELTAMIEALKAVTRNDYSTEVYTDSAYIHNCIEQKWYESWRKNGWKNSKKEPVKNKELWVELLELIESFKNIKIFKVKGHSGDELNELADELANRGIDEIRAKFENE